MTKRGSPYSYYQDYVTTHMGVDINRETQRCLCGFSAPSYMESRPIIPFDDGTGAILLQCVVDELIFVFGF